MLRSFKKILGKPVQALDGEVGEVKDLVLGDDGVVGCLIMESATNEEDREFRVDQAHFRRPDRRRELSRFPVNLTASQVTRCPEWNDNDTEDLEDWVSYRETVEEDRWITTPYENGAGIEGSIADESHNPLGYGVPPTPDQFFDPEPRSFFSAQETCGYRIRTKDDTFGCVEDFLFDDSTWRVHYLMLETKKWLPGSKHCIHAKWLKEVDSEGKVAVLGLRRDQI